MSSVEDAKKVSLKILEILFGPAEKRGFNVKFWDGTVQKSENSEFTLVLNHPGSLRAALLPATELNLAEAYLYNDIDIEGNIYALYPLIDNIRYNLKGVLKKLKLMREIMKLPDKRNPRAGKRQPAKLKGKKHSKERDKLAVTYHYNLPTEFYALWLDKNLVYSCAYFKTPDQDIDTAQLQKLEHSARKLRLKPGMKVLDVGCGWGGFVIYAAKNYGVQAHGITLSESQAEWANKRIKEEGLEDLCKVEVKDYRDLEGREEYDRIISIGMFEHVGEKMLPVYFKKTWELLKPGGLFLNHGIAKNINEPEPPKPNFNDTYVFPDGELEPISTTLRVAEETGFEVLDVESLRRHYEYTLKKWVERLEKNHDKAIEITDEVTYRVWRLFMSGSAYGFKTGRLNVYQALLAKPYKGGELPVPLTREDLYR